MSGSDPLSPPRGERAGQPSRSTEDWSRLDDDFRRIPLNVRKVGRIGATGEGIVIKEVADDTAWTDRPWAEREGIRSFAAHPLLFRDEVLGVLSIFTRTAGHSRARRVRRRRAARRNAGALDAARARTVRATDCLSVTPRCTAD